MIVGAASSRDSCHSIIAAESISNAIESLRKQMLECRLAKQFNRRKEQQP